MLLQNLPLPETRARRPVPLEGGRGERRAMDVVPGDGRRPRHREPHRGAEAGDPESKSLNHIGPKSSVYAMSYHASYVQ